MHKDELLNHLGSRPLGYCVPEDDLLSEVDSLAAAAAAAADSDDIVGADVDVDAVVDYAAVVVAAVSDECKSDVVVVDVVIELSSYCLIEGFVQLAAVAFGVGGGRRI